MKHGSLFSGIGGFDLAAQWAGWDNVFQVEVDKFCQKVLSKNFPNSIRYGDIKQFNAHEYRGKIDIISGGFPCQPFSVAGKRLGENDDRALWPEMLRVIKEIRPTWVIGENVAGFVRMGLDQALSDLEDEGYETESFIIPAVSVGAWHLRERVWIVAYSDSVRRENEQKKIHETIQNSNRVHSVDKQIGGLFECRPCESGINAYATASRLSIRRSEAMARQEKKQKLERCDFGWFSASDPNLSRRKEQRERVATKAGRLEFDDWWEVEPGVGRVVDGLPGRVDRLKGLGNAIVPQVAYQIFSAINSYICNE
jgi:DNA (cytosine-5)-methyltransferase 1